MRLRYRHDEDVDDEDDDEDKVSGFVGLVLQRDFCVM